MNKFTHPFTTDKCIDRLYADYLKHKSLFVAFDFDNTIFDYHHEGGDYSCVIELLKECQELGFQLILFTNDGDEDSLNRKIGICGNYGIGVDYVNESPINPATKPYYNILLDDRAGLQESYTILSKVIDKIKGNEAL